MLMLTHRQVSLYRFSLQIRYFMQNMRENSFRPFFNAVPVCMRWAFFLFKIHDLLLSIFFGGDKKIELKHTSARIERRQNQFPLKCLKFELFFPFGK